MRYTVTIKELALEVKTGGFIVTLTDEWFEHISLHRKWSVWDALYTYICSNWKVPERTIHNTSYCGDSLFRKLMAVEKKRLAGCYGLHGEELNRSLSFSEVNSGPMTEFGSLKVIGKSIFVVRKKDNSILDIQSRLRKKRYDAEIQSFRKNASKGVSFYEWLLSHIGRPDGIGDLAAEYVKDVQFPKEATTHWQLLKYLEGRSVPDIVISVLETAWLEWLEYGD